MVSDISMLNKASLLKSTNSKNVQLPNGDVSQVTHIGSSTISDNSTLINVFLLPQFKYKLMSVSQVTK